MSGRSSGWLGKGIRESMSALYDENEEKKYIFAKKMKCVNCGGAFNDLRVLNSKLRRKEPDMDLRPRFQFVDALKYGVTACPFCGYAAPAKNFENLSSLQQKWIREKITSNFMPREQYKEPTLDYASAVSQYEIALVCAMIMEKPVSEQAYLCLQTSWVIRGRIEEAQAEEKQVLTENELEKLKEKEERYYRQAYDGLVKAYTQEDFPICGMDESTFNYLLAVMSFRFKEYDSATRYCGNVVQARGVSTKLKDKALMLKDDILAAKKEDGEAAE